VKLLGGITQNTIILKIENYEYKNFNTIFYHPFPFNYVWMQENGNTDGGIEGSFWDYGKPKVIVAVFLEQEEVHYSVQKTVKST
jgi:hypothetical protein